MATIRCCHLCDQWWTASYKGVGNLALGLRVEFMTTASPLKRYAYQQIPADDRGMRLWSVMDDTRSIENGWNMTLRQPQWVLDAHNTRKGRIFILGSGPSLVTQVALLPRLRTEETWTVNRMSMWGELGFRPTHHSITEPGPILDWGTRLASGWDEDFQKHDISPFDFPGATNRIAIHWFETHIPGWLWCAKAVDDVQIRWQGFQGLGETLPPLPTGWASPLTSCQLAAWLGFTEFYFLGCDTSQKGQAWDVQNGTTRQPRSIVSILECFDRAKCDIQKAGRKIYDCTPGGKLNQDGVLEYVALEDVLGSHA